MTVIYFLGPPCIDAGNRLKLNADIKSELIWTSVCLETLVHPFILALMRLRRVITFDYFVLRLRRTLVWTCTL